MRPEDVPFWVPADPLVSFHEKSVDQRLENLKEPSQHVPTPPFSLLEVESPLYSSRVENATEAMPGAAPITSPASQRSASCHCAWDGIKAWITHKKATLKQKATPTPQHEHKQGEPHAHSHSHTHSHPHPHPHPHPHHTTENINGPSHRQGEERSADQHHPWDEEIVHAQPAEQITEQQQECSQVEHEQEESHVVGSPISYNYQQHLQEEFYSHTHTNLRMQHDHDHDCEDYSHDDHHEDERRPSISMNQCSTTHKQDVSISNRHVSSINVQPTTEQPSHTITLLTCALSTEQVKLENSDMKNTVDASTAHVDPRPSSEVEVEVEKLNLELVDQDFQLVHHAQSSSSNLSDMKTKSGTSSDSEDEFILVS